MTTLPDSVISVQLIGTSSVEFVDLDIKSFRVTNKVSLTKGKGIIDVQLTVENGGDTEGNDDATVTGVQNDTVVSTQTVSVTDAVGGGATRYTFQSYIPDATGDITWTATINDGDSDIDVFAACYDNDAGAWDENVEGAGRVGRQRIIDAAVEAGSTRLRPILMTTLRTIIPLLPLALGIAEGADTQAPMARTVVGTSPWAVITTADTGVPSACSSSTIWRPCRRRSPSAPRARRWTASSASCWSARSCGTSPTARRPRSSTAS